MCRVGDGIARKLHMAGSVVMRSTTHAWVHKLLPAISITYEQLVAMKKTAIDRATLVRACVRAMTYMHL